MRLCLILLFCSNFLFGFIDENKVIVNPSFAKIINDFYKKYSFDEDFGKEVNKTLAHLNYKMQDHIDFALYETGEGDHYERKHMAIKIFFDVWKIYKELPESDKERFFDKIIPSFTFINWMTVSRLFDKTDEEFIERFKDNINIEYGNNY